MQNKVVSYELCKELDELGFESEGHTGWWLLDTTEPIYVDYTGRKSRRNIRGQVVYLGWINIDDLPIMVKNGYAIKAYDCWDLIMWLQKNEAFEHIQISKHFSVGAMNHTDEYTVDISHDPVVQNAPAKAIIAILKEKK